MGQSVVIILGDQRSSKMRLFVTSLLSSCLILSVSGFHHLMPISGMASYYGGGPSARMTPSHPLASLFGLGHHYPPARSQIMPGYDLYNRMMSGGQHDVTTPSATANPLSSMLRSELSSVRARADQILHQTRAQSAVMAEQYLANLDQDEQCFHRSYCEASIKEAAEGTARAAKEAIKVMEAILANSPASTELPSVQQLVAAYNVGSMTKNAQLCRWLFPCSSAAKAVNSEASEVTSRRMSEEDDEAEARFVTCKHISRLCPGVSLSCGLCAVFGPDSCSIVCPVGAIYCGTSGYACALESAKKNKKEEDKKPEAEEEAVEENATDDEVTTEEAEARTTERSANEEVDYNEDED